VRVATTSGKGHGRLERRTITTTTWLNEYLGDWPGVAQVFRLERRRKVKGREEMETVYGITSLSELAADANALLGYTRGHWGIENGLHYARDVTSGEDACRVRSGTAPQVPAALRNAAIHLLAQVDTKSHPETIEILQLHPERAMRLIGIPQCE
jgi:predicted transposase YbfD/YdcC